MEQILAVLSTLALFPTTALAATETGFWETCYAMMSGMGWMMVPMMIIPLLLIALLVMAALTVTKYFRK